MLSTLPPTIDEFMNLSWAEIEPYYQELEARPLTAATIHEWLADWSRMSELVDETYSRLYVKTTQDTTDEAAEQRFHAFLENVFPLQQAANQQIKQKFLESGLEPDGYAIPLRNLRAEAELFREENLPLMTEERKVTSELNRILGTQTVEWDGNEYTLTQLLPFYSNPDRGFREQIWRLESNRQLADREAINALWVRYMDLRKQIAANAGYASYRDYRWKQLKRFDYTPEDCITFQNAIEQVVVPAQERLYERRRRRLGVETLRPWDLLVDPFNRPPLKPYETTEEFETKSSTIFQRVDPVLGGYYDTLRRDGLLDLENRKGKGPGAYSTGFEASKRPFVFMNAVGHYSDVRTLLHECGHAFHGFECFAIPDYNLRADTPMEFNEVASMAMELLAAPYLTESEGGFYSEAEAARDRVQHLEKIIFFWPYMAVVDAFQHWVYENHVTATDPEACDAKWAELWDRFIVGIDYSGLEADKRNGWHRKRHIHRTPFYYVEYGLAQLGAVQVWRNALRDQAKAVADYRRALALGGTATLPELYRTAGAQFAFDAETLREAVDLIEETIEKFDQ